jgi:hypothetical protein
MPFVDESAETKFLLNGSRRISHSFNGKLDFLGRDLPVLRPMLDVGRVDVMADGLFGL